MVGDLAEVLGRVVAQEVGGDVGGAPRRGRDRARRPDRDHLGAGAAGRAQPEVDDRRPLDDRLVAEHEADLRAPDRRERRPVRVDDRVEVIGEERGVGAEPMPHEARERGGLLDALAPGERDHDRAARLAEALRRFADGLVVGDGLEAAPADPDQRLAQPVGRMQVIEREPALVAEPAVIHLGVVPGEDPRDVALAGRRPGVAPDRAEPADGRDVVDLPWPRAEAVGRREERADRAELGHVAGEVRAVGLVSEGRDHRLRAAVRGHELKILGDVLGEARAAVAEDAALAVERDGRRDRDRLVERPLREVHARRAGAEAEGQVLERAFAALVAVRAVERVVEEDELEDRLLALSRLRARLRRAELEPVLRRQRAGRLELRHPLDLAEAHAAGADRRPEPRLVAEDRDLDPRRERALDHPGALRDLDLPAVDRDRDQLGRAHAGRSEGK